MLSLLQLCACWIGCLDGLGDDAYGREFLCARTLFVVKETEVRTPLCVVCLRCVCSLCRYVMCVCVVCVRCVKCVCVVCVGGLCVCVCVCLCVCVFVACWTEACLALLGQGDACIAPCVSCLLAETEFPRQTEGDLFDLLSVIRT